MWITSRIIFTSKGSSTPLRTIVSVIGACTCPRIFSTASRRVRPWICSLSRAVMKSPLCRPARAAGVSSMGETTLIKPFSIVTSSPRPPNSPWVCTLHIAELLRIEIGGMRIEGHQHAIDCGLDQLVVIGFLDIVGAHALQDLAEKIELPVDLRVGGRGRLP